MGECVCGAEEPRSFQLGGEHVASGEAQGAQAGGGGEQGGEVRGGEVCVVDVQSAELGCEGCRGRQERPGCLLFEALRGAMRTWCVLHGFDADAEVVQGWECGEGLGNGHGEGPEC